MFLTPQQEQLWLTIPAQPFSTKFFIDHLKSLSGTHKLTELLVLLTLLGCVDGRMRESEVLFTVDTPLGVEFIALVDVGDTV
jgi:hypothetical protein